MYLPNITRQSWKVCQHSPLLCATEVLGFITRTRLKVLLRQPQISLAVYFLRLSRSVPTCILRKAPTIISDSPHPANHLFEPLPSGKLFRFIRAKTARFCNNFSEILAEDRPANIDRNVGRPILVHGVGPLSEMQAQESWRGLALDQY